MALLQLRYLVMEEQMKFGGNEDENCNPFSFSSLDASIDYSGIPKDLEKITDTVKIDLVYDLPSVEVKVKKNAEKNSLHIKTDKPPTCEWIGMGIGWGRLARKRFIRYCK